MLGDLTINEFLEKTASNSPVPGGGSVAALSGSLAAALSEMVANLTIGKKDYLEVEDEMKGLTISFSSLREKLLEDIDRDADAFNEVMSAFKLPKSTDEEKAKRREAIQDALKKAALVPLDVAKDSFKMMDLIEIVVKRGNKNAVSDGLVATMLARTAVLSALYNVKINLESIKDKDFVYDLTEQVKELEEKAMKREKEILSER